MIYQIIENQNNTTNIEVNFIDEGIELIGHTTVKGKTIDAENYIPIFEADLRHNFNELFPPPVVPEFNPEEGI